MSSMQLPSSQFKETKIGRMPVDWGTRYLGDLGECIIGLTYTPEDVVNDKSDGILVLRSSNIRNGHLDYDDNVYVTAEIPDKLFVKDGDILICVRNGSRSLIGKSALIDKGALGATFGAFMSVYRTEFPGYIFHLFQTDIIKRQIAQNLGATINQITNKNLNSFLIPLPPLPEQHKIAEVLSTWDEAIAKTERLIAALRERKKGLMQRLLTGQVRFAGFEGEWKEMELGEFLKSTLRKVEKPKDGYLRLGIRSHGKGTFTSTMDDEDSEAVAMTHLFEAKEGDLIVSITFAWEGAIAMVGKGGDGALVSHRFPTYTFDTTKVLPEYFRYLMLTKRFFYDLVLISPGGAGRNRVMSKTDFLKLKVKVPTIEEQKKIGGALVATDEYINALSKELDLFQQQKKGLMQRLLTGEVRVKV